MKDFEGRKIKYAKLHGGDMFIPGFGSFGNTLPPPAKSVQLEMYHTTIGIVVSINNGAAETIVPWPNVQVAVYDREVKPATTKGVVLEQAARQAS